MDPKIKAALEKEEASPFHDALLKHCTGLVNLSRRKMSNYYNLWDDYDQVYRGQRQPDKQDQKAKERGEPIKMIVPLTFAQVQTFVAFCFAMYYQRETMFELVPHGREDHLPAKIGEALMQRDLEYNTFDAKLYQLLLDVARFGVGVVKTGWKKETQMMPQEITTPAFKLFGMTVRDEAASIQNVLTTKYLGNHIVSVSPYRFFPDVRLPISRFQEGEFCASEDEISLVSLYRMEAEGTVAGVKHIKPMTTKMLQDRGSSRLSFTDALDEKAALSTPAGANSNGVCVVTECQVTLIPSKFEIDGEPMGPETYPVKYNVWYVNDNRVIKCEPLGYLHDLYTYDVAEFSPDQHNLLNPGLAETIDQLQSVVTWLINSHITSVRRVIDNKLVVDPSGVRMEDLQNRSPVIRLKDGMARTGVDRWITQLQIQDVTGAHMNDANELQAIVQIVTGINDNALGQFHTGRRSATEARNVNSATASRLKMNAQLIFKTCLQPMGRKLLSNLRDGLDEETYVKVIGDTAAPEAYQEFKKVSRKDLIGDYDFDIFDGTLPTERGLQANGLQELLVALIGNPQAMMLLGFDPQTIAREVLELRGIKHPERFMASPEMLQQLSAKILMLENVPATAQQNTPMGGAGPSRTIAPTNGMDLASLLPALGNGPINGGPRQPS